MPDQYRSSPGVYGPNEIEAMMQAYRGVLRECCDGGSLAGIAHSSLPARDLRRMAAKQVVAVASIGITDSQRLLTRSLARLVALRPATP